MDFVSLIQISRPAAGSGDLRGLLPRTVSGLAAYVRSGGCGPDLTARGAGVPGLVNIQKTMENK